MNKFVVIGGLIGFLLGLFLPYAFPNLVFLDMTYRSLLNEKLVNGSGIFSVKSGTILLGGGLYSAIGMFIGAFIGKIIHLSIRYIESKLPK
ncbi:MAG: hypothetical protein UW68_C0021G0005 [Candidatus Collierbacteria bacterium GW2011_GWB1_44_6]|nr:MAG: hypothetical protein UW68_C0021G0005 [Candidatus Collierbacteria bacterium GW2011_GWB1_44_6]